MRSLVIFAVLLTGCSGAGSVLPTAPTPLASSTVTAVAAAPMQIRGYVMDTAFRPLVGARVEVVDGPSLGTSAEVDAAGQVLLTGFFDATTRFRVTKEGHESLTQAWTCSPTDQTMCPSRAVPWLGFYLRPLAPPLNLSGDFTLTLTADSSCADLPQDARSRSYGATIAARSRAGTSDLVGFDVTLRADAVLESLRRFGFGVAGDFVHFGLRAGHGDEPALVEDLGGNRYIAFTGAARAAVNPSNVAAFSIAFDGWIDVVSLKNPLTSRFVVLPGELLSQVRCESSAHRLDLTRR